MQSRRLSHDHSIATAGVERQYAHLDRFGRVTRSAWIAPGGAAFHDVTLTHDRGSNITSSDDAVAYGLDAGAWVDAAYGVDDLGRLTGTREGGLVSGSISTGGRTREELWTTLSPTPTHGGRV